jgi:membrane protein DedA with SNARE-associated domain
VAHFLESWGYLAIFVLSLISAMGIPVGAEAAILLGGALASGHIGRGVHPLNLALVILAATAAELLGSFFGYLVGRRGGRPLVDRLGRYILLTNRDLDRAESWFARRGDILVLVGRFVPLLRSFISLAAGLGEMAIVKFTFFTAIGCAIWCTALAAVGYSVGSSYNHVLNGFSSVGYGVGAAVALAMAGLLVHRLRACRRERTRADRAASLELQVRQVRDQARVSAGM